MQRLNVIIAVIGAAVLLSYVLAQERELIRPIPPMTLKDEVHEVRREMATSSQLEALQQRIASIEATISKLNERIEKLERTARVVNSGMAAPRAVH